jgi:hypothetical protein
MRACVQTGNGGGIKSKDGRPSSHGRGLLRYGRAQTPCPTTRSQGTEAPALRPMQWGQGFCMCASAADNRAALQNLSVRPEAGQPWGVASTRWEAGDGMRCVHLGVDEGSKRFVGGINHVADPVGNTGIQHRVWMTGNQPGQDQPLPRPALLSNVPLGSILEH